ncbi:MAG TPA: nuclear transport factor 2 family protein [Flavobacteriales bacterium]|nr:nuclear transport factor 2 family protein [Flavobacteriales bacterium]
MNHPPTPELLALIMLCIGCGHAATPLPDTSARDEQHIRSRYASMDSLFAIDSMAAIASVYHDSARIVTGRSITRGRAAVTAYWDVLKGRGISWDHGIEELTVRGDRAIQHGTSKLLYRRDADTILSHVRYTVIWVRDSTGEWWIDLDHYTQEP